MRACSKCGIDYSDDDFWQVSIEEYHESIFLCYDCKTELVDWMEGNDER